MRNVYGFWWLLFLFLSPGISAQSDTVPNEWILIQKRTQKVTWARKFVSSKFKFVKTFGHDEKFALVRGELPAELKLHSSDFSIQPNYVYHSSDAMDPDFENSWGLNNTGQTDNHEQVGLAGKDIQATLGWGVSTGLSSTVVAIVDSGIDLTHEDLLKNLWVNKGEIPDNQIDDDKNGFVDDINGWNFVSNTASVQDDFNHGSMCAGIIGAEANNQKGSRGINWQVSMMAVKALDNNGLGTTENTVSAIQYAVQNGATIVNTSWGQTNYDQTLYDEVNFANQKGVIIVAAAGNDGKNNDSDPSPTYPAAFRLPNIIAVAAYDNRDNIADFSNYGPETVNIGAPGVGIFSTKIGGYDYGDGTSYAAPFVSGTAALVKSFVPGLSMADLIDRLLETSEVISYYEKNNTATAGRISAYNALQNIRPPRPNDPTQWTQTAETESTPHPYGSNSHLEFDFNVPGAEHIRVHFSTFDTEQKYDTVSLIDGNGTTVITYSGNLGSFTSADALGDSLRVVFTSDASINASGFDIDYMESSTEPAFE
jgi:thermitase